MKDFKRINRESVYKGAIIEFCKDQVITPEGNRVEWDYLIHKGAAAIIPVIASFSFMAAITICSDFGAPQK